MQKNYSMNLNPKGRWGQVGPWLGGPGGLSLVGSFVVALYVAVFHVQGVLAPLIVGAFSSIFYAFSVGFVSLQSQKEKKKRFES